MYRTGTKIVLLGGGGEGVGAFLNCVNLKAQKFRKKKEKKEKKPW